MLVLLCALLPAALAEVPVEVGGALITTLPTAPRATLQVGQDRVYLLTADQMLQRWDRQGGAWSLTEQRAEPEAAGLFLAGGGVWVERHTVTAVPLAGAAPALQAVNGRPPKPEAPRAARVGLVTGGEPGAVLIDLGRADGLRVGSPLRFLRQEAVPGLSGGGSTTAERAVGDGRVQAIEDHQALVLLSRGSRVAAGDLVERSEEGPTSVLAPARLDRLGEAGFVIRPMLPLDTLGVAFVNEAWVSWTFAGPWYVEGRLSPVGLGWSQDGNPLSVAGVVAGGLDNRFFSVGLGAGGSGLNKDLSVTNYQMEAASDGGTLYESMQFDNVDRAFSVAQQARLGARDGLNLVVRNTFVLVPKYTYDSSECVYDESYDPSCNTRKRTGSAFTFGGIAMRGSVPVGARTDLFVDWGTGQAGATWVTGGVATWLHGNGDAGSLGLEVAAGYGEVVGSPNQSTIYLNGPLVSAGARWRFGR
jgi:hypothetical protein